MYRLTVQNTYTLMRTFHL